MKDKISPALLLFIISLMVTFILVQLNIFGFFSSKPEISKIKENSYGHIPRQETEAGMYRTLHDNSPVPKKSDKTSTRKAKNYYKNRAYPGAPPTIPHKVNEVITDGGFENCLQCHQNGSYSVSMKKHAPIAPHPEYKNCRQCHVPKLTNKLFKKTKWHKTTQINIGRRHLPGSPPVIPHTLQLRENCLSCHFGKNAVEEIKVTHPERVNCRQCHVETNTIETFKRDKK